MNYIKKSNASTIKSATSFANKHDLCADYIHVSFRKGTYSFQPNTVYADSAVHGFWCYDGNGNPNIVTINGKDLNNLIQCASSRKVRNGMCKIVALIDVEQCKSSKTYR